MAEGANLRDLLNSGNIEELRSIRDSEIQRYQVNAILLHILKSGAKKKFEGSTPNLIKSIKITSVKDYIKLENGQSLLGLNNLKINLSYTEKKHIKNFVIGEIKRKLLPLMNCINNAKREYEDIFNPIKKRLEIIVLEQKRRDTILQLIELKNKKLFMLKNILDIKLSPFLQNELKLMHTEYRSNQQKINLLNHYIAQEFVCRSDYTDKAIKEIVKYIDTELENE